MKRDKSSRYFCGQIDKNKDVFLKFEIEKLVKYLWL